MSEFELELYKVIGDMLRSVRSSKSLTLDEISKKLDITPKTLQRYECGERRIKISMIESLCKIYGIDYYSFIKDAKLRHAGVSSQIHTPFSSEELNIINAYRSADSMHKEMVLLALGLPSLYDIQKGDEEKLG